MAEALGDKISELCEWVKEKIGQTLTFYQLPLQHHKHMKSTNMLERFNEEIKRRTRVVRIFPNEASCYLNMELLKEHKKLHFQAECHKII